MEDLENRCIEELQSRFPDLHAVYIYGSAASGELRVDSDVDLAILGPGAFDGTAVMDALLGLSVCLGRDVDLVDLRSVPVVLRMQVVSTGRRIFCRDFEGVEGFEDYVFSSYARLNEERAGILADIRARGTIYG